MARFKLSPGYPGNGDSRASEERGGSEASRGISCRARGHRTDSGARFWSVGYWLGFGELAPKGAVERRVEADGRRMVSVRRAAGSARSLTQCWTNAGQSLTDAVADRDWAMPGEWKPVMYPLVARSGSPRWNPGVTARAWEGHGLRRPRGQDRPRAGGRIHHLRMERGIGA